MALDTALNTGDVRGGFAIQQVSNVGGSASSVIGFDSAPRWQATFKNYEAYAVTGMKLKWIPTNMVGGVRSATSGALVNGTGNIDSESISSYLGT